MTRKAWVSMVGLFLACVLQTSAQIDPTKRELIQLGYNQPIEGRSPIAAYAFYYLNLPQFYQSNLTLRLAIAPIYLDGELGISDLIGQNTDFAIGAFGGGFADGYNEVRGGKYLKEESFSGHGGGLSASLYHRFNPAQTIPLNAVVRVDSSTVSGKPPPASSSSARRPTSRSRSTSSSG